ncbi:MAG: DNA polymerase I [Bacteroidales bacterium]|nr:DNA polymerase I [Bacteroidales bacterium]MCM1146770.1 DNA polymerase I [Bacteroidales bacterium]MCM1205733.1 DNA polymerase I [Bacillota bacterium]MCM1510737.1 DNA polymerase I [Clostridium sp.]
MDKIFLIDAYALIYRSYYALLGSNFYSTQMQMNTGTVHGFMNTLHEVISKEQPTHIGVAFDHGKTFRHEAYPPYKAQRQETPEDIKAAVPVIKELLSAMNIPVLQADGFEADDVIGAVASLLGNDGNEKDKDENGQTTDRQIFMLTPDKDYGQLVSKNVFMYKPRFKGGYDVLGEKEICEKYSISSPKQVVDILALMGDSADNFPGCPGVGEKTAVKLISEWGNCENIIEHAEEIKGALGKKVREHIEDIRISKFLAKICTDIPEVNENLPTLLSDMECREWNTDELARQLDLLELRQIKRKFLAYRKEDDRHNANAAEGNTEETVEEKIISGYDLFGEPIYKTVKVKKINIPTPPSGQKEENIAVKTEVTLPAFTTELIDNEQRVKELCDFILTTKSFGFHLEATSSAPMTAEIISLTLVSGDKTYFLPLSPERQEAERTLAMLRPIFENESIEKIGHDLKAKIILLHRYGIALRGTLWDVMIAHYLLECGLNPKHTVNDIAFDSFKYIPANFEEIKKTIREEMKAEGKKVPYLRDMTLRGFPEEKAMAYCTERAFIVTASWNIFRRRLEETEGMWHIFNDIEMPLMEVLCDMELTGIAIDLDALREVSRVFNERLAAHEQKIYELAGEEFTLTNPKKLGIILFEKLRLMEKPKKTKTGQYATGEEILTPLRKKHPIINEILEYKGLKKLINTYVDALPLLVNKETGRIHTTFNQCVTTTGRLSSSDPNLQNIPVRGEDGKEIRRCFIPLTSLPFSTPENTVTDIPENNDGTAVTTKEKNTSETKRNLFFSADYSQIELRVMAHLSNDERMIEAFRNGTDIHRATAATVYHKPFDEVTPEERSKAKRADFGIIYGITQFGLAQNMGIERSEAKELMNGFFLTFPKIQDFMENRKEEARRKEYAETMFHRRRYLRLITSGNGTERALAEREAMNSPVQGTAADIIKIAMVRIFRRFREENLHSKMLLQVHDELNFSVLPEEKEKVQKIVLEEMQSAVQLSVPLIADYGWGDNWLEAH